MPPEVHVSHPRSECQLFYLKEQQEFRDQFITPLCAGMRDLTTELRSHAEEYRRLATTNRGDIDGMMHTLHGPDLHDGIVETVKLDHQTISACADTLKQLDEKMKANPDGIFGTVGIGKVHASGLAAVILLAGIVVLFQIYFMFLLHGGKDPFGKYFAREPATTMNVDGGKQGQVTP